jgi:hypothetical protein
MAAAVRRACLRALGIPTGSVGARQRHPEQPRGGAKAAVHSERLGEREIEKLGETEPAQEDISALGCSGHRRYDRRQMVIGGRHPVSPTRLAMWEGDESAFSSALVEEVWHKLTRVMTWPWLLATQLLIEVVGFLVYSSILTLVGLFYGSHGDETVLSIWGQKVLLCLATMRLNTDAIFGFKETAMSSNVEIAVLSAACWFHWLLLTLSAAVIVARALLPIQQLVFAPDCVVNFHELAIRVCCPRWRTVSLYNISIKVCAMVDGRTMPLKLLHGVEHWPVWPTGAVPITVRHDVTDISSPFHPKSTLGTVALVTVHVSAEDQDGNRISQGYQYLNPDSSVFKGMGVYADTGGARFPRYAPISMLALAVLLGWNSWMSRVLTCVLPKGFSWAQNSRTKCDNSRLKRQVAASKPCPLRPISA